MIHALRDYQTATIQEVGRHEREGHRNIVIVAPTGAGKTVMATALIHQRITQGDDVRVLALAHRKELIDQLSAKLDENGLREHGIIQANHWRTNYRRPIQVASIQTLLPRLRKGIAPPVYDYVLVDEAHHTPARTYLESLDLITKATLEKHGRPPTVLGLTATPYRSDGKGLAEAGFEVLIQSASMIELMERGYLVSARYFVGDQLPDLSGVKARRGDFDQAELSKRVDQVQLVGDIIDNWRLHANGRSTIVFAVDVEHSNHIVDLFNGCGVRAEHIDANTPKGEREAILKRLADGTTTVCSNVGVLCLDDQTEILTRAGWRSIDSFDDDDLVACWDDGEVEFHRAKATVRRDRLPGEKMVRLETKNRSIRVTEDHWMVHRSAARCRWRKTKALDLAGRSAMLPVCGRADPESLRIEEPRRKQSLRRRLVANSYTLRKKKGLTKEQSYAEAESRLRARDKLRYTQPHELTHDDCRFIGFWIGDGTVTNLQSGGREWCIHQSMAYPYIIEWVDRIARACGFKAVRKIYKTPPIGKFPSIRWSFCRGTGFGQQQRDGGIYRIEHYLNKNAADWLWALDREHLSAFLDGFWMADGQHGDGRTIPTLRRIANTNKRLLDTIQAVAACRGFRASLHAKTRKDAPSHHSQIYELSISTRDHHAMTKYTLEVEPDWKPERVWCVTSKTGNIITRRRGTVTVTGNTEGFDCPRVSCCVLARPTKSVGLYLQMAGRALRPFPGKDSCLLLDHAGVVGLHGFLTDEREVSLEAGVSDAKDKKLTCPHCLEHLRSWPPVCPWCGGALPALTKPKEEEGEGQQIVREVIYADQSLVEVSPDVEIDRSRIEAEQEAHRQADAEKAKKTFLYLVSTAQQKGFKPGWVLTKFRAWTGREATEEDQSWSKVKVRAHRRGRRRIVAWEKDNELPLFEVDA